MDKKGDAPSFLLIFGAFVIILFVAVSLFFIIRQDAAQSLKCSLGLFQAIGCPR
ncbi:MAG: hypothetical protein HY366_00905 [Candidatus Aenigmarchaeota archaeon]|nr:hypothetical protein [Candidatus Aenigmarchaeota archaeon]